MYNNILHKRIIIYYCLILLGFALSAFSLELPRESEVWLAERESIFVAIDVESPPYGFIDRHGNVAGFNAGVSREFARLLGVHLVLVPVRFSEQHPDDLIDRCDLIVGVFEHPDLAENYILSDRVIESEFRIYTRASDTRVVSINDLSTMRVAVQPVSPFQQIFTVIKSDTLIRIFPPKTSFVSLVNGDVDVVVLPRVVGDYALDKSGFCDDVISKPFAVLKFDYLLGVPKRNGALPAALNACIDELKREGRLAEIRDKWLERCEEEGEHNLLIYFVVSLGIILGTVIFFAAAKIRNFSYSLEAEKRRADLLGKDVDDLDRILFQLGEAATLSNVGIFAIRDVDGIFGKFIRVNDELGQITCFDREELLEKSFTELFEGEDLKKVVERYKLRKEGEQLPESYEVMGIRSDGERRPVELSVRIAHLSDGPVTVGIVKDLSRIKTLQRKLRNSDQNFRATLSSMPDGAIVLNKERILYVNSAFRRLVGRDSEWIRSNGIARLLPSVHVSRVLALVSKLLDGREIPQENRFEFVGANGDLIMVSAKPRAVNYFGEPAILMVIKGANSKSEPASIPLECSTSGFLKTAEDLVLDYNNSVMAIVGAVNNIGLKLPTDSETQEYIRIIEEEAERVGELTAKLLSMSRETDEKSGKILSIHAVIKDALELLPRPTEGKLEIHTPLNARPDITRGNLSQIHQAILNLMVNAVESMQHGGILTIATGNDVFGLPNLDQNADVEPGRFVWVSVSDSGPGISNGDLNNIFRPFFRAKNLGAGIGLGLSLVQKLVKKHGGFVKAESEIGQGSKFTAYFPEEICGIEERSHRKALPGGTESILVVDDEPHIRTVLKSILGFLGYRVLLASDGLEALEIMRLRGDEIDLILLDIIMPGMGGDVAFKNIKNIHPEVKVIVSTGYADDEILSELLRQGADYLVRKPYFAGTIAGVIRNVLDEEK